VLRSHARALEDWTGRPRPLELGDDEPPDELEATDRALCCSSIPFGAVALKVRFCPSGLALLRRELRRSCENSTAHRYSRSARRTRSSTSSRTSKEQYAPAREVKARTHPAEEFCDQYARAREAGTHHGIPQNRGPEYTPAEPEPTPDEAS
jgi:hypothetical protein